MALNPAEYLADLVVAQPLATDPAAQADDHLRAIKKAAGQTFPMGFDAALSVTQAMLNGFEGRIASLEAIPPATFNPPAIGSLTISSIGDHTVTGVGFQPAVIMCFAFGSGATVGTQTQLSVGISGAGVLVSGHAGSGFGGYEGFATGDTTQDAYVVMQGGAHATAVHNRGSVKSLDADGFTLTESVGQRTANIMWIAFK